MRSITRFLLAAYLIEAGVLLILTPWTSFWERNRFFEMMPFFADWMTNRFVRGAVSGVGVVTTLAGLGDLVSLLFLRSRRRVAPVDSPPS